MRSSSPFVTLSEYVDWVDDLDAEMKRRLELSDKPKKLSAP